MNEIKKEPEMYSLLIDAPHMKVAQLKYFLEQVPDELFLAFVHGPKRHKDTLGAMCSWILVFGDSEAVKMYFDLRNEPPKNPAKGWENMEQTSSHGWEP